MCPVASQESDSRRCRRGLTRRVHARPLRGARKLARASGFSQACRASAQALRVVPQACARMPDRGGIPCGCTAPPGKRHARTGTRTGIRTRPRAWSPRDAVLRAPPFSPEGWCGSFAARVRGVGAQRASPEPTGAPQRELSRPAPVPRVPRPRPVRRVRSSRAPVPRVRPRGAPRPARTPRRSAHRRWRGRCCARPAWAPATPQVHTRPARGALRGRGAAPRGRFGVAHAWRGLSQLAPRNPWVAQPRGAHRVAGDG